MKCRCGEKFEKTHPRQKYCSPGCAYKAVLECNAKYAARKKAEQQATPSRHAPQTIPQVLDLARKAGMSYGKYVSMQGL